MRPYYAAWLADWGRSQAVEPAPRYSEHSTLAYTAYVCLGRPITTGPKPFDVFRRLCASHSSRVSSIRLELRLELRASWYLASSPFVQNGLRLDRLPVALRFSTSFQNSCEHSSRRLRKNHHRSSSLIIRNFRRRPSVPDPVMLMFMADSPRGRKFTIPCAQNRAPQPFPLLARIGRVAGAMMC
jgi:hypothetical protein